MIFTYIALTLIVLLLIINIIISLKASNNKHTGIDYKFDALRADIQRIETAVKTEIATNRKETFDSAGNARNELATSLASFKQLRKPGTIQAVAHHTANKCLYCFFIIMFLNTSVNRITLAMSVSKRNLLNARPQLSGSSVA